MGHDIPASGHRRVRASKDDAFLHEQSLGRAVAVDDSLLGENGSKWPPDVKDMTNWADMSAKPNSDLILVDRYVDRRRRRRRYDYKAIRDKKDKKDNKDKNDDHVHDHSDDGNDTFGNNT